MTQQLDRIVGARQAADAGPGEIAPIVMWSYLAALVKEYDALSARAERAEAQVRAVGVDMEKLRGDVHHLVQPIIGHLRMVEAGRAESVLPLAHYIDRLWLVLALMDEAATGEHADDEHRGRHGVGLNHYPALAAGLSLQEEQE